jgi:hypothetical protein
LKIFFSRTTCASLTWLGTNHPWEKGIQVCSNEVDSLYPRGDNNTLSIFFLILFSRTGGPNSISFIAGNKTFFLQWWLYLSPYETPKIEFYYLYSHFYAFLKENNTLHISKEMPYLLTYIVFLLWWNRQMSVTPPSVYI